MNNRKDISFIYFIIVCLLAMVVLLESLVLIRHGQPVRTANIQPTPTIAKKQLGSMELVSLSETQVKLVFNSPEIPIGGVDAIILFDPKVLKIVNITPIKNLFNQFVTNDTQATTGLIKITAYYPQKQLTGTQIVAILDIQYLKKIPTSLALEFKGAQLPADSNLTSQIDQQDVLGTVKPLMLNPGQ
jgi:hypothetical protein